MSKPMAEDRVEELRAELETKQQQFAQIINNQSKQNWAMRHELEATKEKLEASESKIGELEAENFRLAPKQTSVNTCHHIKENGTRCGSPAVSRRRYCHYHLGMRGRRLKMARARARRERWQVELPPLENLYAVQVAAQNMLDALASGQLDRRLGMAMLHGLQQAASNLRLPREVWDGSDRFDEVARTTLPNFERDHGLPQKFDVDTPPEEAFPMPVTGPGEIELPGEEPVSEGGRELEELLARDPEACRRRAGEQVRKYRRRLRYNEEKLEQALAVLEAAQRTTEVHNQPSAVNADAVPVDGGAAAVSAQTCAVGAETQTAVGAEASSPPPGRSAGSREAKKLPQAEPGEADKEAEGAS